MVVLQSWWLYAIHVLNHKQHGSFHTAPYYWASGHCVNWKHPKKRQTMDAQSGGQLPKIYKIVLYITEIVLILILWSLIYSIFNQNTCKYYILLLKTWQWFHYLLFFNLVFSRLTWVLLGLQVSLGLGFVLAPSSKGKLSDLLILM